MISAKFKGNFSQTMQARLEAWSSQNIAAKIIVPPELAWWYYQEYGVAARTITPNESSHLVLPGPVFLKSSPWPGIQGTHTVGTVLESLPALAKELLPGIFASGNYEPLATKERFMEEFMPRIKKEIVELMAANLPGTREADPQFPKQGGKLGGRTASSVFDEQSTIEESTE